MKTINCVTCSVTSWDEELPTIEQLVDIYKQNEHMDRVRFTVEVANDKQLLEVTNDIMDPEFVFEVIQDQIDKLNSREGLEVFVWLYSKSYGV